MRDAENLIGSHVWSHQNDLTGVCSFFSLMVNMKLTNNNKNMKWYFLSVTLKDMSIEKVTT